MVVILNKGYRVFSVGKERPGRDSDSSPFLVPWSRKSRVLSLLPYETYGLYRASVPVQGCTLPYIVYTSDVEYILYIHVYIGHAVEQMVEALRYKPEGLGFDSRWRHWKFSLA